MKSKTITDDSSAIISAPDIMGADTSARDYSTVSGELREPLINIRCYHCHLLLARAHPASMALSEPCKCWTAA
jgi:hypothetical protein